MELLRPVVVVALRQSVVLELMGSVVESQLGLDFLGMGSLLVVGLGSFMELGPVVGLGSRMVSFLLSRLGLGLERSGSRMASDYTFRFVETSSVSRWRGCDTPPRRLWLG